MIETYATPTDPEHERGINTALRASVNMVLPATRECMEAWSARDRHIITIDDDDESNNSLFAFDDNDDASSTRPPSTRDL
jgi:hypothetical protein